MYGTHLSQVVRLRLFFDARSIPDPHEQLFANVQQHDIVFVQVLLVKIYDLLDLELLPSGLDLGVEEARLERVDLFGARRPNQTLVEFVFASPRLEVLGEGGRLGALHDSLNLGPGGVLFRREEVLRLDHRLLFLFVVALLADPDEDVGVGRVQDEAVVGVEERLLQRFLGHQIHFEGAAGVGNAVESHRVLLTCFKFGVVAAG